MTVITESTTLVIEQSPSEVIVEKDEEIVVIEHFSGSIRKGTIFVDSVPQSGNLDPGKFLATTGDATEVELVEIGSDADVAKTEGIRITQSIPANSSFFLDSDGVYYTRDRDVVTTLGNSNSEFIDNEKIQFYVSGLAAEKDTIIIWEESNKFKVTVPLDPGDSIRIVDFGSLGTYSSIQSYLNRRVLLGTSYIKVPTLSNNLITNITEDIISGPIAIGFNSSATNGGILASRLTGNIGTSSLITEIDTLGSIGNLVSLRYQTSKEPVLNYEGLPIYGLLQTGVTIMDGTSIGGVGSPNLQVSFFKMGVSNFMRKSFVSGDIEMSFPLLYLAKTLPSTNVKGLGVERLNPKTPCTNCFNLSDGSIFTAVI